MGYAVKCHLPRVEKMGAQNPQQLASAAGDCRLQQHWPMLGYPAPRSCSYAYAGQGVKGRRAVAERLRVRPEALDTPSISDSHPR